MKEVKVICPKCGNQITYKNWFGWVLHTPFHWFGKRRTKCANCGAASYVGKERRWNDLTEVSPPVNKEVELKITINGEERIYIDRLIPMMNCTYIWQYGDYSGCDGEAAWRYISK